MLAQATSDGMTFWNFVWLLVLTFFLVAFLMLLFQILGDLYSDPNESGWGKFFWTVGLLFFPIIGALVYLIVRGGGMQQRAAQQAAESQHDVNQYIRSVANSSPSSQLETASQLHDSGKLTDDEYAKVKERILNS